jgi:hypothetical protein
MEKGAKSEKGQEGKEKLTPGVRLAILQFSG